MKKMPLGKWKGVPFTDIPTDSIRGMSVVWAKKSLDGETGATAIYLELTEEILRRDAEKKRRRRDRRKQKK